MAVAWRIPVNQRLSGAPIVKNYLATYRDSMSRADIG
jgi:hypothetical protein